MSNSENLIGTTEAAKLLGVSQRTIHRMVADNRLQTAIVVPGGYAGVYLFNPADVEKLKSTN